MSSSNENMSMSGVLTPSQLQELQDWKTEYLQEENEEFVLNLIVFLLKIIIFFFD